MQIKRIRKQQNISIRQLSEMTGIPKTNLNDLEAGRRLPRAGELEKIAQALEWKSKRLDCQL